jgi:ABC-type ATPase involved in cell division
MFEPSSNAEIAEEPVHDAEPIIAFSHVSISFDGRPVLEDVSFHVGRGQTLCILGRSGVGKSVALRMLMGFLSPDSGSIRVESQEITGLDEEGLRAIRKRVTMVFQNGALFDSLSVRENVAFPLRERGDLNEKQVQGLVDQLITMVGAEDVVDALPASLSTGRKRAVAIARRATRGRPLRRANHDGRSHHCPPPRRSDSAPQATVGIHQRCGHTRYAICRAARRPRSISPSGAGLVFWRSSGIYGLNGSEY